MTKWLLRGGRVVDPANGRDGVFDVLIDGDRIERDGRDPPIGDRRIGFRKAGRLRGWSGERVGGANLLPH